MDRKLLFLMAFVLLGITNRAQIPGRLLYFSADSLQGFDEAACQREAVVFGQKHHLSDIEKRNYIYARQRRYIQQKYGLTQQAAINPNSNHVLTSACNNVDFENGDYTGWVGFTGYNANSGSALTVTASGISTLGINSPETGCSYHTLVNSSIANDPWGLFPQLDPGGGNFAVRMGGENINRATFGCSGGGPNLQAAGEVLEQTFTVNASNALFTYKYAVILNDGGHAVGEQPYFKIEVLDNSGNPIPCLQYYIEATNGTPPAGFIASGANPAVYYCNWTANSLNLTPYIGQTITVRFTAAGCIYGAHFGYGYFDASCGPVNIVMSSATACQGSSIQLTAPPGANGYQWAKIPSGAGIVSGSTSQTCTVNQNGHYRVTVSVGTCTYTIDTTVAFIPLPVLGFTPVNVSCNGAGNGSATVNVTSPNAPFTYSWNTVPSQNGQTSHNLVPGTYSVTVTSAAGCASSGTVNITQPPVLTASPGQNNPTCTLPNGSAQVTAGGGTAPYTYSWTPTGGNASTAPNLGAGTYTCVLKDGNGCQVQVPFTLTNTGTPPSPAISASGPLSFCLGNNVTLTASGGSTYSWRNGPASSSNTVNASGNYLVYVSNSCGTDSAQVSVTVLPLPHAVISGNITFCTKDSSILTVSGTGTFSWSTGATSSSIVVKNAGVYKAYATTSCGVDSAQVNITVLPLPQPLITGNTSFCAGDSSLLVASGGTAYSWNNGITTNSIKVKTAGVYVVHVSTSCGTDSAQVQVTVLPYPNPVITGVTTICAGDSTVLTASGGIAYSWSTGATTPSIKVGTAGSYTVTAFNSCGGSTASTQVNVDQVLAHFTSDVNSGYAVLPVNFLNGSSATVNSWSWDFGDQNYSTDVNPSHSYGNPGVYTVSLEVMDPLGCKAWYKEIITVTEEPSWINAPNVFTPNGDGINDEFLVRSAALSQFHAKIFDRWGVQVAELDEPDQGWDGHTKAGMLLSDGTYYYEITATGKDGKTYTLQGFVMLIRG